MAADVSDTDDVGRARVIRILAAATFLVFFQAFMVAPLLPRLAVVFSVSAERVGMIVPAYLLPYGIATLSLGYDLTQPLFAGIVTTLDPARPGQTMGLNVFALFTGFAAGSAAFGVALRSGFARALIVFGIAEALLAVLAVFVFASERRAAHRAVTTAADEVADRG